MRTSNYRLGQSRNSGLPPVANNASPKAARKAKTSFSTDAELEAARAELAAYKARDAAEAKRKAEAEAEEKANAELKIEEVTTKLGHVGIKLVIAGSYGNRWLYPKEWPIMLKHRERIEAALAKIEAANKAAGK
jgi:multidrug efflux pump subunit AcrA (membrane-fusion protein)